MNFPTLGQATSVADLGRNRLSYPKTAPCMHPECAERCTYRDGGPGKKAKFCSPRCAKDHGARRRSLISEVARLDQAIATERAASRAFSHLTRQRTHALWLLERYGGSVGQ